MSVLSTSEMYKKLYKQRRSRSTLFAHVLRLAKLYWQQYDADDLSRRHFQITFAGALRINPKSAKKKNAYENVVC